MRRRSVAGGGKAVLAVGALGVVFGDIGTSPIYAMQTVFAADGGGVSPTPDDIVGVVSLIFWSVTLVVAVKYVIFVLRADNEGEGGVLSLAALVRRIPSPTGRHATVALALGVLGASLFYGDSLITPAVSVLSAVEGVSVVSPDLTKFVLPAGLVILALLFAVQHWGTGRVGRLFGPVMVVWFVVIGVLGLRQVATRPDVLLGLLPSRLFGFVTAHPGAAFGSMGAVVLMITGAEALYADMGHFGRRPVRLAWFALAFPALVLNYLGQAGLILEDPRAVVHPFYLLAPGWARPALIVLATLATVIAAQAVITGAFSMSRQAIRLGYLPSLTLRHTSGERSGQVYLPAVNWMLFAGVVVLMVGFGSSEKLSTAYGLAVTGTLLVTTVLFLNHANAAWGWAWWQLGAFVVVIGGLELVFLAANLSKFVHGGWLPASVALVLVVVMTTWRRGHRIVAVRRAEREGPLRAFVERLRVEQPIRVAGCAVFPHQTDRTVPLALRANVEFNRVVHDHVVVVTVVTEDVPHVPPAQRPVVDDLGHADDGVVHLRARFGFHDEVDVPAVLAQARVLSPELPVDLEAATYFMSRVVLERSDRPGMRAWRERLFVGLAHASRYPGAAFGLPVERTIVVGSRIEL